MSLASLPSASAERCVRQDGWSGTADCLTFDPTQLQPIVAFLPRQLRSPCSPTALQSGRLAS
jgi:hypothetical protein